MHAESTIVFENYVHISTLNLGDNPIRCEKLRKKIKFGYIKER